MTAQSINVLPVCHPARADYPKGVIGIYDNAGQSNESADRYTVVYEPYMVGDPRDRDGHRAERLTFPIVTMSDAPYWPQGVCLHGETPFRPTGGWQSGPSSAGKTIAFEALPADCQRVVREDLATWCDTCHGFEGHSLDCTSLASAM